MTLSDLLKIHFSTVNTKELDNHLSYSIENKKILTIVKINAEFVVRSLNDKGINKLINAFDLRLIDGASLIWADRLLGKNKDHSRIYKYITTWGSALMIPVNTKFKKELKSKHKYSGIDLTIRLLEFANKHRLAVGIVTSREASNLKAVLSKLYPSINNINIYNGNYSVGETISLVHSIKADNNNILFVATGFPKQESFIDKYKGELGCNILIGEGGSFDYSYFGGKHRRAPKLLRNIGLEWFWRLLLQPRRLKRQLAIPKLIQYLAINR